MASKRRIRRNQCRGKERFPNLEEAQYVVRKMLRGGTAFKSKGWLSAYGPCRWCSGYHVGHRRRR